jgi:hypothetical protein
MTMVERRKIHETPFMTRGAAYASMFLGLICLGMAAFNVYLWNDSRQTRAELTAERTARLSQRQQDQRSAAIGKVVQCRQAIPAIARANSVIADLRADHRDRAAQARALAQADPTEELRAAHLRIARQQDRKAKSLKGFVPVTMAQCDDLARKSLGPNWRKILAPPKAEK